MRISTSNRLTRTQKTAAVGLAAAAGVAALTATAPGAAHGGGAAPTSAKPVAGHSVDVADHPSTKAARAATGDHAATKKADGSTQSVRLVGAGHGKSTAENDAKPAAAKKVQADNLEAKKLEARKAAQADKAEQASKAKQARAEDKAGRAADRTTKADNLDGWIKQARSIMKQEGIPGSYNGIKKNIIRESGGDPNAMNDWDVNAQKGTPSKGLLQTIQPTFDQYHVQGTTHDVTDPVANIVAACNYAADKYGSMDNVNSAY